MKKSLLAFALLSVVAMPFFFSCNKPSGGNDQQEEIVLPDPPSKAVAKKVEFSGNDAPVYNVTESNVTIEYKVLSIEFTEGNRYILKRQIVKIDTKAPQVGDIETIVGTYSESNGTYDCNGFGDVNVNGSTVDVKPDGGGEYSGTATVKTSTTSNTQENNIARTWKVDNIVVKVSGGVSIEKAFTNGCDLHEIATYAANNGVDKLKNRLSEFEGYKVNEILFTGSDTFTISFTGANAVSGTYSMAATAKTMSYNLSESSNAFFHGSASGTFDFPAQNKLNLVMNTTLEGYTCNLDMNLTAVNR